MTRRENAISYSCIQELRLERREVFTKGNAILTPTFPPKYLYPEMLLVYLGDVWGLE